VTAADEHLARVVGSFEHAPHRLRELLEAAVRHLHGFVRDVGLTREEWAAGIAFLTSVGQACTDDRQELILLSDTLGVSMLVEMLSQAAPEGCTEPTVLGPFYVEGAPVRADGDTINNRGVPGERLMLSGQVRSLDGTPLAGATLDVWEVQPDGLYDVQTGARNMRGLFTSGADGRYRIGCVRPVDYRVPVDGPVGRMLDAAGRDAWRPGHIHVIARAAGHKALTTHVFDAASPWLDRDAVFGVRPSLVIDMSGGEATFDIVLEPA
jgi:hydroxyquinol 1,2-dioxygenase